MVLQKSIKKSRAKPGPPTKPHKFHQCRHCKQILTSYDKALVHLRNMSLECIFRRDASLGHPQVPFLEVAKEVFGKFWRWAMN